MSSRLPKSLVYWMVFAQGIPYRVGMESVAIPAVTVLVVDDDPRILSLVAIMLSARGYRVIKSNGAADALRIFEQRSFEIDMLLSDVVMPGMSGPELNARFQVLKPDLPALFMTGYAESSAIPSNVLEKPFRMDELFLRVAQTLRGERPASTDMGRLPSHGHRSE